MTIGQLQYDGGGDWYANPPGLPNLLRAIRERTGVEVAAEPGRGRFLARERFSLPSPAALQDGEI